MSYYNTYRPSSFEDMKGNFKRIQKMISKKDPPHSFIFYGPPGCGKTTTARIIANYFGAEGIDLYEINIANDTGVDAMRDLISKSYIAPFGKAKVYILDEFHKASDAAQNVLLKSLEEPPLHNYFIICTTEVEKIIPAVRSRCTEEAFTGLTEDDLYDIVKEVIRAEDLDVNREEIEAITSAANGSARRALVLLEQVAQVDRGERLRAIQSNTIEDQGVIDLCRALYSRSTWNDIRSILRSLKGQKEEPEKIRRAILGYGQSILLSKWDDNVVRIMTLFEKSTFESGFPGLVLMCTRAADLAECGRF